MRGVQESMCDMSNESTSSATDLAAALLFILVGWETTHSESCPVVDRAEQWEMHNVHHRRGHSTIMRIYGRDQGFMVRRNRQRCAVETDMSCPIKREPPLNPSLWLLNLAHTVTVPAPDGISAIPQPHAFESGPGAKDDQVHTSYGLELLARSCIE